MPWYIWLNFMVNVGKYAIHGSLGTLKVTSKKKGALKESFLLFKFTLKTNHLVEQLSGSWVDILNQLVMKNWKVTLPEN